MGMAGDQMAFPFKRILAPVDFDSSSLKGLELAAKIARQGGAGSTIFILHIVPLNMDVGGTPDYASLIKRQESLDREKLTAIAEQHLADVKWKILDRLGEPAHVIDEVAKKLPADLIVMVTHGRRGLARLIEGSIAEKVLRNAPCPVLAVR
jgi:nucleotide-binding universal stress UspA family protein